MYSKQKTKDVTLAALLTAFSLIITLFFPKIVIGPFSMTFASHVPTMLEIFINPLVAFLTVIGSTIGFQIALGPLVAIRAFTHILFALLGYYLVKKRVNIFLVIILTSIAHAGAEALSVFFLTEALSPISLTPEKLNPYAGMLSDSLLSAPVKAFTLITFYGTLVQHYVDCVITAPVLTALQKAKLVNSDFNFRFTRKSLAVSK